jgi:hypothetical protein
MKKLLPWLILGLFVRLLLIPFTIHPDFRAVNLAAYLIAQKGEIFTFYDHISRLPRTDHLVQLYGDDLFIYPPLAYITHAFFNKVLYPLYPQSLFWTLINDFGQVRLSSQLPVLLFLLKLPYLLADLLGLFILRRLVPENRKFSASLFWLFNPIILHSAYMMGQFDIFIVLFILASLYFSRITPLLAPICIGLAAGFKPFPLLLLPFLPGSKTKNVILGIATYIGIIVPYLSSPAFKQYALMASQSDKLLFAKIMVSGSQYLSLFFVGLLILFWWNYFRPYRLPVWGWFTSVLLLFYSVTHYHPQWFVWVMPFLAWAYSYRSLRFPVNILIACYVLVVLLFEPSLNFGLFGIDFSFSGFINTRFPVDQFASLVRSAFAGTAFFLVHQISSESQS